MGNFVGHVLPGSLFIIFSILWSANLLRFYFSTFRRKHVLTDGLYFESKYFHKPLESMILVFVLPIAILGEYLTAFNEGPTICADNVQHMTMYLFFLILSIVNLIECWGFSPLPSIVDQLYGCAFGVETLLLYFHTHGQGLVEQHLHKLLTFSAFMCTISSFLSGIVKSDIIIQLSKPLFVLLQGTWFIQIAFLLYPPFELHPTPMNHLHESDSTAIHNEHLNSSIHDHHNHDHHNHDHHNHDHHDIMINTARFCWHFAFCLLTIFVLASIYRKKITDGKQEVLLNQKYQRLLEETST